MERLHIQFDKYTKIWNGPKATHFFDADCSIGKILYAFMRNNPKHICQVMALKKKYFSNGSVKNFLIQISDTEGTALTNGEAITFAIRIAQYLKSFGLRQDDVVGIVGANTLKKNISVTVQ